LAARPSRADGQRVARSLHPRPALGWATAGLAHVRKRPLPLSSLPLTDVTGPRVRAASLLKPSATTPSKATTDRIHPLNLFLPYLEHLRAI
jgi:hypothetical protein